MSEPTAPEDAPKEVLLMIGGILQFMDSTVRLYGHPDLLAVAEAVNGPDFTPFTEVIWVKQPRLGAAVSWHQDGTTHWNRTDLDAGVHGFNFMANLYETTPENALWVLPGSHHNGKADLKNMMAQNGSDRLEGTVPMLCKPGDIALCNRQVVHGSFPNTSDTPRATYVFGFHRRSSVLNVQGWSEQPYTEDTLRERTKLIKLAVAARKDRYPSETSFEYAPLRDLDLDWNQESRDAILKGYQTGMIGI